MPREDGFHGEFRQRLQQGQNRQGNTLRDEELCRFGAPRNHEAGDDDGWPAPENRERTSGAQTGLCQHQDGERETFHSVMRDGLRNSGRFAGKSVR